MITLGPMVNVRHGRLKVSVTLHMSLSWNKIARNLVLIANKVSLNYFIRIYLIAVERYVKCIPNIFSVCISNTSSPKS